MVAGFAKLRSIDKTLTAMERLNVFRFARKRIFVVMLTITELFLGYCIFLAHGSALRVSVGAAVCCCSSSRCSSGERSAAKPTLNAPASVPRREQSRTEIALAQRNIDRADAAGGVAWNSSLVAPSMCSFTVRPSNGSGGSPWFP